jgi:hypothetical protein
VTTFAQAYNNTTTQFDRLTIIVSTNNQCVISRNPTVYCKEASEPNASTVVTFFQHGEKWADLINEIN